MTDSKLYEDIAGRSGGNIYIGVVGPVRTGKSTFIKRFMETLVIPNIENVYAKERARDELPQSGSGKTIMTAEPKFVPEEAVPMNLREGSQVSIRLIDCVGYMVPGAQGALEDGRARMVTTPWFEEEIDLSQAAEEGTRRVIRDHSTVGLVITTDGSICGIDRADYVEAEGRVVSELKQMGKPFLLVLNSTEPNSESARALTKELSEKYEVSCVCVNCLELREGDIRAMFQKLLDEFQVEQFSVYLPQWVESLPADNEIKRDFLCELVAASKGVKKLRDADTLISDLADLDFVDSVKLGEMETGRGAFSVVAEFPRQLYYKTISDECGLEIVNDGQLITVLSELALIKKEYDKVSDALKDVREKGYGVVVPTYDEMELSEPEIVRRAGKYGVVLRAQAPAIHMLKTTVENEVKPAVGGEQASEEILGFLLQSFEGDASRIWESNIFGKSMYDIAGEGLTAKLRKMPEQTSQKLRLTLQRLVNEGKGGLICIVL
jgi:stage IV sporulation protein A